jgi:hypothetical protein
LVEFTPVYRVLVDLFDRDVALVWGRVKRYTGPQGVCYAALDTMAAELGMTRKYLYKCLRRLVDNGWLDAQRRIGATTIYRMPSALQAGTQGVDDLGDPGRARPTPQGVHDLPPQGARAPQSEYLNRQPQERTGGTSPSTDLTMQAAVEEARRRGKDNPEAYAVGMLRRGWKPSRQQVTQASTPEWWTQSCAKCSTVHHPDGACPGEEADDD